jgi:hypothetical protein
MQGVQRKNRPKDRASIPFLFDLFINPAAVRPI